MKKIFFILAIFINSSFLYAQKDPTTISDEDYYDSARTYHLNHQFDNAIESYNTYLRKIKNQKKKEISRLLYECENGKEFLNKPIDVSIKNMGEEINTVYPEYLPLLAADGLTLIFTSRRKNNNRKELAADGKYYEDIYITNRVNGQWESPSEIGSTINSKYHDAAIGLSFDGYTLFIYNDKNGGDIYTSELKGDQWSKPENIGIIINTEFFESSAFLSANERELFFVSNRPGGFGGKDIYVCNKNIGGSWSKPKNLGRMVNTEYDEESPFLHPDGVSLYFSSKGHKGMGGYDIFRSERNKLFWTKPENIGYPVNSSKDDVYFVISADKLFGYYASVKDEGYGEQDLYIIRMPISEKPPLLTFVKGQIKDGLTQKPIEADIIITDNVTGEITANLKSNSKTGKFLVSLPSGKNYGLTINKEQYLFHSENFKIEIDQTFKEIKENINLFKLGTGAKVILKNIFFDTDKSTLRMESDQELERLVNMLIKHNELKISINGHTDSIGTEEYNLRLSEDRAKEVILYLKQKGINEDRLFFTGFGESKPIASNSSEEGRQLNRRIEFLVLEKTEEKK